VKFIYMNEGIRCAKPSRPVIVVQSGKNRREGNRVAIKHQGRVIASVIYDHNSNPSTMPTVRAWIQTNATVVVR